MARQNLSRRRNAHSSDGPQKTSRIRNSARRKDSTRRRVNGDEGYRRWYFSLFSNGEILALPGPSAETAIAKTLGRSPRLRGP